MANDGGKSPSLADLVARIGARLPGPRSDVRSPSPDEASIPAWIERLLAPYLQSLGPLGALLPRVLERVDQLLGAAPPNEVLLFRARSAYDPTATAKVGRGPDALAKVVGALAKVGQRTLSGPEIALYRFIQRALDRTCVATPELQRQIDAIRNERTFSKARGALVELIADERRRDLPRHLEELKHAVRADREQGFAKVQAALQWLLKSDAKDHSAAYALLERLSDHLGEICLRRLMRQIHALDSLLEDGAKSGSDLEDLRTCFAALGLRLGERVSVIRGGPELRPELLVMDHEHDRYFEVRQGSGSTEAQPWSGAEIFGAEPGRNYPFDKQDIKLPLRVHDAAQGLSLWSVDRRLVQESRELNARVAGIAMRPWDIGANRTPVAVFFAHFRDTDIGEYYEIGLGCFVAPLMDPLSVGVLTLGSMPVSAALAQRFGVNAWGYPKEYVARERWKVRYRADHLQCEVQFDHAAVKLRLPRGGAGSSSAVPVLLYTRKPTEGGQWHRSAMMRFARGESVRIASSGVELSIEFKDDEKEKALRHPLLGELYRLGLVDAAGQMQSRAMLAAWSENVSAHLGAGTPLQPPEPRLD